MESWRRALEHSVIRGAQTWADGRQATEIHIALYAEKARDGQGPSSPLKCTLLPWGAGHLSFSLEQHLERRPQAARLGIGMMAALASPGDVMVLRTHAALIHHVPRSLSLPRSAALNFNAACSTLLVISKTHIAGY